MSITRQPALRAGRVRPRNARAISGCSKFPAAAGHFGPVRGSDRATADRGATRRVVQELEASALRTNGNSLPGTSTSSRASIPPLSWSAIVAGRPQAAICDATSAGDVGCRRRCNRRAADDHAADRALPAGLAGRRHG
jgi:hypothetical protein